MDYGDKVNVLVACKSKDLHAGNLVKELASIIDGRGGSDANGIQYLLSAVSEQL